MYLFSSSLYFNLDRIGHDRKRIDDIGTTSITHDLNVSNFFYIVDGVFTVDCPQHKWEGVPGIDTNVDVKPVRVLEKRGGELYDTDGYGEVIDENDGTSVASDYYCYVKMYNTAYPDNRCRPA